MTHGAVDTVPFNDALIYETKLMITIVFHAKEEYLSRASSLGICSNTGCKATDSDDQANAQGKTITNIKGTCKRQVAEKQYTAEQQAMVLTSPSHVISYLIVLLKKTKSW